MSYQTQKARVSGPTEGQHSEYLNKQLNRITAQVSHSHPIDQLSLVDTESRQKVKLESALAGSDSDTKIIPSQDLGS